MLDFARWTAPAAVVGMALAATSGEVAAQPEVTKVEQRIVLVTGSTGGLGREVALRLAADGAHVLVHGRNETRGREVVEEIERQGSGSAQFYRADLASLAEVRQLAEQIRRDHDRLDLLVNNAGIWITEGERQLSQDGYELHFHVNYLAGYLLTHQLLPLLERSAAARIVNVASGAQTPIDFNDVQLEREYSGSRAYAQSKLAQILFTIDLAEQLASRGIVVASLHPATFMATDMVREAGITPRSTVEEGADAVMNLIESRQVESGSYYSGLQPSRPNPQALDAEARQRLRTLSEQLVQTN